MSEIIPARKTPEETAEILGVSPKTLAVWRCRKTIELPYVKAGRKVWYLERDIADFLERNRREF